MPRYDDSLSLEEVIRRVFPQADQRGIRAMLARAQAKARQELGTRVELAALLLSGGDLLKLEHYLEQAVLDSRDVLYWAFYYDDEPPPHMRAFVRRWKSAAQVAPDSVLNYVRNNPGSSGEQVAEEMVTDTATLRPVLRGLIEGGTVTVTGKGRGTRYAAG